MVDEFSTSERMAFPFLEAAVRIDQLRQSSLDKEALREALNENVALWFLLKNHVLNTEPDTTADHVDHIVKVSNFMAKAAICLINSYDDSLMDHMVKMNLNMCERLLAA